MNPDSADSVHSREPRARRALLAWGATWAASLLLVPGASGEGAVVDVLLAAGWLLLLGAGAARSRRLRDLAATCSGLCLVALWALVPRAYPVPALVFVSLVAWGRLLGPAPRLGGRTVALALVPAALPALLAGSAWAAGDDTAHAMLRNDWRFPSASFAVVGTLARVEAVAVFAWLVLARAGGGTRRSRRAVVVAAGAVLVAACGARATTLASLATLPGDAQWSEAPLLLNLLKLRQGAPIYGPLEDCNSYSYGPALELVHHALLAPIGLDLSLVANRALALGWQVITAAILTAVVLPFTVPASLPRLPRVAGGVVVTTTMLLVATSSFLGSNLHPDHLLMPWFALALGLALHARRVSPALTLVGLLVLPPISTAIKLTGAGIGVGLALAFARPPRRRTALALAGAAALSVGTLLVLDRTFPGFWRYTFALQASHPVRWHAWTSVFSEAPGRLMIAALAALAAAFLLGPRAREARNDASRAMLVTLGFTLPSLVAYLKVGGRSNSLLPLAIGSAVVLFRLAGELGKSRPAGVAVGSAVAVWGALTLVPATEPVAGELRARLHERHATAVTLVRDEVSAGRRTLFYEGTSPWLDAGQRDVPRDRWQIVNELLIGHHPEVGAHFARLESGAYDSLIMSDAVFDPQTPAARRLASIVAAHYQLEPRPFAEPNGPAALPPLRLYRWVAR